MCSAVKHTYGRCVYYTQFAIYVLACKDLYKCVYLVLLAQFQFIDPIKWVVLLCLIIG
jgi:hypothetical protein